MIEIINKGQRVIETNYWDSDYAQRGFYFLSWNAGAARLLVPDSEKKALHDMRSADYVVISRGPWTERGGRDAIELLFEDGSDAPFVIHLGAEQCDRLISDDEQGGGFAVAAWTRSGQKHRWPGKYRTVPAIPCLEPWLTQ